MNVVTLKCPMCGASVKKSDRACEFCGSSLIITSIETLNTRNLNTELLDSSAIKWKEKLKFDPNSFEANYSLGMIYLNKKLRDTAIKYLRVAIEIEPEAPFAHYNLSMALFDDGKVPTGSKEWNEVQKELDLSIKTTDYQIPEAGAFKQFFIARKLADFDKNGAIKEYKIAIELCPDIPIFYNNLAFCYGELKRYEEAVQTLKKAMEFDNITISSYLNICTYLWRTAKYDEGLEYAEKGIAKLDIQENNVRRAALYNVYGLILRGLKREEEALANIKKAIAFDPTNKNIVGNLIPASKKCFIATAAMGDYNHPVVVDLRTFRDNWLLKKTWGVSFTNWYYKHGPKAAKVIERSKILRWLTYILIVKPLQLITKKLR